MEQQYEQIRKNLDDEYTKCITEALDELEKMTDYEAKMSVAIALDTLDLHLKKILQYKAELRDYIENRKNDAQILRDIYNRWIQ